MICAARAELLNAYTYRVECGIVVAPRISLQHVAVSLKYAVVERERWFLVSKLPDAVRALADIEDVKW
jgi:hypothetical protein